MSLQGGQNVKPAEKGLNQNLRSCSYRQRMVGTCCPDAHLVLVDMHLPDKSFIPAEMVQILRFAVSSTEAPDGYS